MHVQAGLQCSRRGGCGRSRYARSILVVAQVQREIFLGETKFFSAQTNRTSERDLGSLAVFATHRPLRYVGIHAM